MTVNDYTKIILSYDNPEKIINDLLIINNFKKLKNIFENPILNIEKKIKINEKLFKNYFLKETIMIINFLIKNNNYNLIKEIIIKSEKIIIKNKNQQKVEIITAREYKDEEIQLIIKKIEKKIEKNIIYTNIIDKKIIGGIIIKIGDNVYNNSLNRIVNDLKKILIAN